MEGRKSGSRGILDEEGGPREKGGRRVGRGASNLWRPRVEKREAAGGISSGKMEGRGEIRTPAPPAGAGEEKDAAGEGARKKNSQGESYPGFFFFFFNS